MLRFGVLWRKRSIGSINDKGDRWVERILSLRQTSNSLNYTEVVADPEHPEHEEFLAWRAPYDLERFDLAKAYRNMKIIFSPAKRKKSWQKQ